MRVPLSWLGDYIEVDLEPERLAERLTMLGMEVSRIERIGADWQNVVVGELLAVEPHPRADRLSLTRVTIGTGEPLEIVCGATNIARGQRVPVALPGAVLPGGRRIDRAEKLGVVSNGMLCSGDELRLTGDAEGILILPADVPLGRPLADLYGDVVLDIDVKPNRGDALSLIGLAREVSIVTGAPVTWPLVEVAEDGPPVADRLAVEVADADLCPRFVARWVSDVRIAPSSQQVQMRLIAAGMRPVSNVVDASNYVMLELGKPIHTFDAAAVRGGRIIVRRAASGERLETLDHVLRELTDDTLIIADREGPLAIAGIIGGAPSEIGDATRDVVIESAIFDPVAIRRTGQRYGLRSEASLRFEKGIDLRLARIGADRTARLIHEWAGGTVAAGRLDSAPDEPTEREIGFRPARVGRLLGLDLDADSQRAVLARAGIVTRPAEGTTRVPVVAEPGDLRIEADAGSAVLATIPTWRQDLAIEGDIAEEIARIHGYEEIPATLPDTTPPGYRPSPLGIRDVVRETLVGAGLSEVVSHALVSPRHLEVFAWSGPGEAASGEVGPGGSPVTVLNPLSPNHSVLRQGLLASLADAVGGNVRHGRTDLALFEVGKGYGRDTSGPREWWRLGIALTGNRQPAAWNRPARAADIDDVKGLIELIAQRLRLATPTWRPLTDERVLHPGRAAIARSEPPGGPVGLVGHLGELHPSLVDQWDLRVDRVVVAELSIAGLSGGQPPVVRVTPIPRHPAVERDLAIVVAETVPAAAVDEVVRRTAGPLLAEARLFDIYRGAPLGPGDKSLAERLVFQAADRTLTDSEVESIVDLVSTALAAELGARLRT